jgi:hypothetical protein
MYRQALCFVIFVKYTYDIEIKEDERCGMSHA